MKARRVALLIAAASAVAILGVLPTVTKHQCYKRSLFEIERQHFDSVLKRRALSGYYVFGLRRSKSANEVYVYLDGQMLEPKVICLSDRGWKVLNGLGRMSYFDENGRVVASF